MQGQRNFRSVLHCRDGGVDELGRRLADRVGQADRRATAGFEPRDHLEHRVELGADLAPVRLERLRPGERLVVEERAVADQR